MKITNVNSGVDPSRIQQGQPPYFVNWREDGENKYAFFSIPSVAESCKQRLLKEQGV